MVQTVMSFAAGTPIAIILIGAYYVLFSPISWGALVGRICARKFTRGEIVAIAFFAVCVVLEWIEYSTKGRLSGALSLTGGETWGLVRYFGTFAPILWLWLAWLLAKLWSVRARWPRYVLRLLVIGALGYVVWFENIAYFHDQMTFSNAEDVWTAAKAVAPIIKADYKGPAKRRFWPSWGEYHGVNRPCVFGGWGAAAWEAGGSSEGANRKDYPGKEDYLFVRAGEGYYGQTKFEHKKYKIVAKVDGVFGEWYLLRRKGAW